MNEILLFLKEHLTIALILSFIAILISILSYRLNRKKFKNDNVDFENKKSKFSMYLENSYRFNYRNEQKKYLLFDVRINNFSTVKNSFISKLRIVYYLKEKQRTELHINHDPTLFHDLFHSKLIKFSKEIRIEDRDIKSGWLIFKFPKTLSDKRIDFYELIIEDTSGNNTKILCNLIREIDYEN